jgi:[acyl-carrier-protein] S-malonyltransferase
MAPAQERLAGTLAGVSFSNPRVPLVNNVDAAVVDGAEACREGLVRQVSAPVRWQDCVERLAAEGVETYVELGPGQVLGGLIRRTVRGARILSVEDPGTLEKALAALSDAGGA